MVDELLTNFLISVAGFLLGCCVIALGGCSTPHLQSGVYDITTDPDIGTGELTLFNEDGCVVIAGSAGCADFVKGAYILSLERLAVSEDRCNQYHRYEIEPTRDGFTGWLDVATCGKEFSFALTGRRR